MNKTVVPYPIKGFFDVKEYGGSVYSIVRVVTDDINEIDQLLSGGVFTTESSLFGANFVRELLGEVH